MSPHLRRGRRAASRLRSPPSPSLPSRPASSRGAGIWGYIFLTAGRGLAPDTAGVAVSAYWAMMFAGRVVLGPVAQRLDPARVLAAAVVGIPAGAALMTAPGPGLLAVIGLMTLGLAAAPVFPLLTRMTPKRAGSRVISPGDAEVGQPRGRHRPTRVEHDVARLEVTVDDARRRPRPASA